MVEHREAPPYDMRSPHCLQPNTFTHVAAAYREHEVGMRLSHGCMGCPPSVFLSRV